MERYWMEELHARCVEICTTDANKPDMVSMVVDGYYRILKLAEIGRKEGLLELDDAKEDLDRNEDTSALFYKLISLVIDGTDPKIVSMVGMSRYASSNLMSYRGLLNLMYIRGALMIQAGDREWIIAEVLKSMMPDPIIEELNRRESERIVSDEQSKEKEYADMIERLCKDDKEIDEEDHSVVSELARSLIALSNKEVERLLREVDTSTFSVAMKGLPGKARARIFENLSPRLASMTAEQMSYMGPVRFKDVEEYCVKIMKTLRKLVDEGEVANYSR